MHKQKVIISVGLIAVEIILLITGFGEISNGSLSITILHIPVILAAILLGLPYGEYWEGSLASEQWWLHRAMVRKR